MGRKAERKEKTQSLTPEAIRKWSLETLMGTVEANLDMARLVDPSYLSILSPEQAAKIKKVITDRNGVIVSVELVGVVEMVTAAANIAGTREAAKVNAAKKAEEEEKAGKKHRSNKLILSVTPKPEEEKPAAAPPSSSDKHSLSEIMKSINGKK
jgi:hypothetical protein